GGEVLRVASAQVRPTCKTHSPTHPLTHSLTHSLKYSHTHTHTHSHRHFLTQTLSHTHRHSHSLSLSLSLSPVLWLPVSSWILILGSHYGRVCSYFTYLFIFIPRSHCLKTDAIGGFLDGSCANAWEVLTMGFTRLRISPHPQTPNLARASQSYT